MSNLNSNKAIEDYRSLLETIKISEEILEMHKELLCFLNSHEQADPDGTKRAEVKHWIAEDEKHLQFLNTLKSIDSQFVNLA